MPRIGSLHSRSSDVMTHVSIVTQTLRVSVRTSTSKKCFNVSVGSALAGMSSAYYSYPAASDEECMQVIHRALELGVNHLDTSDAYGPHTNEKLVGGCRLYLPEIMVTPLPAPY